MIRKLMLKLLPIQILFAVIGAVNGIVSGYFATNYVGVDAMSAVGLYAPLNMLFGAVSIVLVGGAAFLGGRYIGQNEQEKVKNIYTLDIIISVLISLIFTAVVLALAVFDLTGIFTKDAAVRPLFNRYLLGQALGILPFILGNQFTVFLSMENKQRLSVAASLSFIAANLVLDVLFVKVMHMEAFGLALASSLGLWVFCLLEASYFIFGNSYHKMDLKHIEISEAWNMIKTGFPGAESNLYQTIRGLAVNWLLEFYVGSMGLSAFAAANNLMALFWALPTGMLAVSRLLISVAAGEEDRQTIKEVMGNMLKVYLPLQLALSAIIIACAVPFTNLFFKDSSEPVYMMTVWGFRILPLCMPFSIILMHYVCYVHAIGRHKILHVLQCLDGVVGVVLFTAVMIKAIGMNSVYIANVLNGVLTTLVICIYAFIKAKRLPRNLEDLLVIPKSFGVPESERMDLTITDIREVTEVAANIQEFCEKKNIDKRRSYIAGLAMEEMAGNVVDHGFTKDNKKHSVDLRVVHKNDDIILRIKDDCIPFDPKERSELTDSGDPAKNIGIRMIYKMLEDIQYQNVLGLNILTMKI